MVRKKKNLKTLYREGRRKNLRNIAVDSFAKSGKPKLISIQ